MRTEAVIAPAPVASTAEIRAVLSDLHALEVEKVIRSKDEALAHHEASHAVVAHACGVTVGGVWLCRWKPREPDDLLVEPSPDGVPHGAKLIRLSPEGRRRGWRHRYSLNERGWGQGAALYLGRHSDEAIVVRSLAGPIGQERFNGEHGPVRGWPFGTLDYAGSDYIEAAVGVASMNETWLDHPLTWGACTDYLVGEGRAVAERCADRARALVSDRWSAIERLADELLQRQVVVGDRLAELIEEGS